MDGLYLLKKIVANWLAPLPLCLLLILLGMLLLWRGRHRMGLLLGLAGWLTLVVLSIPPVADLWLQPLEQQPMVQPATPVAAIVVLGCSYHPSERVPVSSWLADCSSHRVMEGVIQWRRAPDTRMIFTGGGVRHSKSVATAMAAAAHELGVPLEKITALGLPRDTAQEAASVAALLGSAPIRLVTSASHMPRASRYFTDAGLTVIATPAHHLAFPDLDRPAYTYAPDAKQLYKAERAWYESLGLLWQRLGGH